MADKIKGKRKKEKAANQPLLSLIFYLVPFSGTLRRLFRLWAMYARMDLIWITRDLKMFLDVDGCGQHYERGDHYGNMAAVGAVRGHRRLEPDADRVSAGVCRHGGRADRYVFRLQCGLHQPAIGARASSTTP